MIASIPKPKMRERGKVKRGLFRCVSCLIGLGLLTCVGLAWSVSAIGNEVRSCLTECSRAVTVSSKPFKFFTLNIYHGFPLFKNDVKERVDLIAHQLREMSPDFAFLQEVPWRRNIGLVAEYLARKAGYNFVYLRGNGNSRTVSFEEGLAILSRYPLRDPRFTELSPRNGFIENRIALAVIAETSSGPIQLVTAHLPWDETNRINAGQMVSLEAFIQELEPQPTILAGDFNAREESHQIQKLSEHWVDAFRLIHKQGQGPTCCLQPENLDKANAGQYFDRVDYVFLKDNGNDQWVTREASRIFDHPFRTLKGYQWATNHAGVLIEANLELSQF